MWYTVLITPLISSNFSCWSLYFLSYARKVWRYQRDNQNGNSYDRQYNDQQEKFEDIKGVIRTVTHMTISSNFSCWLLYCLSCDIPFWLPLWYLQTFLVGHCISCHTWQAIQWPTRKVCRYQRGNQNGKSHDRKYND
jgi:hypothetical protein